MLEVAVEVDDAPICGTRDHDIAPMAVVHIHHEQHMARGVTPEPNFAYVVVKVFLSAAPSLVESAGGYPEVILPRFGGHPC